MTPIDFQSSSFGPSSSAYSANGVFSTQKIWSSGNFLFKKMSKGVLVDPSPTTVKMMREIVVVIMRDEYSLWTCRAK